MGTYSSSNCQSNLILKVFIDVRELVGSITEFDVANYAPTNSCQDSQRIIIGKGILVGFD